VFGALVYLGQGRVLFPATREIYRDPGEFGWAFQDVFLPVGGDQTHGWFLPLNDSRGVVLFSHGNAGNIADRLESIGLLRELGFSVMAYDYGGYGKSTGDPSERRCYADIRAVWRYLTEARGIPPERIVLFGRSLGGAVTADLAKDVEPAAVVLESTFLSTRDVARDMFRWFPFAPFVTYRFETKNKIADFRAPLLLIHSPDDRLILFHNGKELFERAHEPKTFLQISGDHNEGFVQSMTVYVQGWEDFLQPLLPRPEPNADGKESPEQALIGPA
jgi:alpha-beta hydrolase superfamily lysophospholipase